MADRDLYWEEEILTEISVTFLEAVHTTSPHSMGNTLLVERRLRTRQITLHFSSRLKGCVALGFEHLSWLRVCECFSLATCTMPIVPTSLHITPLCVHILLPGKGSGANTVRSGVTQSLSRVARLSQGESSGLLRRINNIERDISCWQGHACCCVLAGKQVKARVLALSCFDNAEYRWQFSGLLRRLRKQRIVNIILGCSGFICPRERRQRANGGAGRTLFSNLPMTIDARLAKRHAR